MLLLTLAAPAHAYLDPGTGSMIIQGIVAAIAVAGVTMRAYWAKVQQFFGMGKPAEPDAASVDNTADQEQQS